MFFNFLAYVSTSILIEAFILSIVLLQCSGTKKRVLFYIFMGTCKKRVFINSLCVSHFLSKCRYISLKTQNPVFYFKTNSIVESSLEKLKKTRLRTFDQCIFQKENNKSSKGTKANSKKTLPQSEEESATKEDLEKPAEEDSSKQIEVDFSDDDEVSTVRNGNLESDVGSNYENLSETGSDPRVFTAVSDANSDTPTAMVSCLRFLICKTTFMIQKLILFE